ITFTTAPGATILGATPATAAPTPSTTPSTAPTTTTSSASPQSQSMTRAKAGYWMLGSDGAVYPFGATASYGDATAFLRPAEAAGLRAARMAIVPGNTGYWIADDHGAVYAFGSAPAFGSLPSTTLHPGERVTTISASAAGRGYWLFT